MTEEQEKALMAWVAEVTRQQLYAAQHLGAFTTPLERTADALCEAFGYTHTDVRTGLPVKPAPEPTPRAWRVGVPPHAKSVVEVGILDQYGTWWTHPDGTIWTTRTRRTAAKKARELNGL